MISSADVQLTTFERIRVAASDLMCEFGYAGMSMRNLAAAVGVKCGSLYNHVESKQLLLFELIHQHEYGLLMLFKDRRLSHCKSLVRMHSRLWDKLEIYSTECRRGAWLAKTEMHHLDARQALAITKARKAQQQELLKLLAKTGGNEIGLSQEGLESVCREFYELIVCHIALVSEPNGDPSQLIKHQLRVLSARLLLVRD